MDRSLLVELKETQEESKAETQEIPAAVPEPVPEIPFAPEQPTVVAPASEATRVLEELLRESKFKPHWPMYLRTFKQLLRSLQPPFDERQYGITSTYDLVRQLSRDGLLRVERNRQGILRIFPAERFPRPAQEQPAEDSIPTETTEFTTPVSEPQISRQEPEAEMPPESPATLTETLPEPAESVFTPEEEPPMPVGNVEERPAQKPKAKPRKKAPFPRPAKAKGETRRENPLATSQRRPEPLKQAMQLPCSHE